MKMKKVYRTTGEKMALSTDWGKFHIFTGGIIPHKKLCTGEDHPHQISLKYF